MKALYIPSIALITYVVIPLIALFTNVSLSNFEEVFNNEYLSKTIIESICTTMVASGMSVVILILFGTPLAYFLARSRNRLKNFIQSIIDLPMALPHSVIGIMLLLAFQGTPLGYLLKEIGITIIDNIYGIIAVMVFVGLPFYVNGLRNGIEDIPESLEIVARSLGASPYQTFIRITLPLSKRSIIVASLLAWARGISEIGALLILAYNPMTLSVLVYEWYKTLGLEYALTASTILTTITIILFLVVQRLRSNGND